MLPTALFRQLSRHLGALLLALPLQAAAIEALPVSQLPSSLQDWVPWAMQGHEDLACPPAHNSNRDKACVWPRQLQLEIKDGQGWFRSEVEVIGPRSAVMLPGEAGAWPDAVRAKGAAQPLPVVEQNGRPVVWLPAGKYQLEGRLRWQTAARSVRVPTHTGVMRIQVNGQDIAPLADAQDRIWLRPPETQGSNTDGAVGNDLDFTIHRLIDDGIPRRITTRYTLNVAGQPRELDLPAALLASTQAEALRSTLPARLYPDGRLQVQLRAGSWEIEVDARQMSPLRQLQLPPDAPGPEIWSYQGHNDLHITRIDGVPGVDPKQANVPEGWQRLPAFQLKPGSTMAIMASTQGNAHPAANTLHLERAMWLDFDGGGYTLQDHLHGRLSRDWRLELASPARLGHAADHGTALPVSLLPPSQHAGVELRQSELSLHALSRIEGRPAELPVNGWNSPLASAQSTLNLPPGWTLLHVSGVESLSPDSLLSRWRLFDFFFVLLGSITALKLLGLARGLLLTAALVLSWHELNFVGTGWLMVLACLALVRVLPQPSKASRLLGQGLLALILLLLLPFTVHQIRTMIYPSLEHQRAYYPASARAKQHTPLQARSSAPLKAASSPMASEEMAAAPALDKSFDPLAPQPSLPAQTGPGVPAWQWNTHTLHNHSHVEPDQYMQLHLLPPAATAAYKLLLLLSLYAALWVMFVAMRAPRQAQGNSSPPARQPLAGLGAWALAAALLAGWPASEAFASEAPGHSAQPQQESVDSLSGGAASGRLPPLIGQPELLQALRERLYPPAECLPDCAALAHLHIDASKHSLKLRLNLHVQARTQVPLPALDASGNWQLAEILDNGQPATTRRDRQGQVWILLPPGAHDIELRGALGGGHNVRLALPLAPRMLTVHSDTWQASDLGADGLPKAQLLNLEWLAKPSDSNTPSQLAHVPDALPGFAVVERTLLASDRWQVETLIRRAGVSQAPVRVRFALLPGESVNDDRVQVHDGVAEVLLGQQHAIRLNSTLPIQQSLQWRALPALNQIERWQMRYSSRWHPHWQGLTPIQYSDDPQGQLAPRWQPWPGESLQVDFVAPEILPGPTLTLEQYEAKVAPGLRSNSVTARLRLRASLAGSHRMQLPSGAELLDMTLDGVHVPLAAQQGQFLDIPIVPGEHEISLRWRESRGIQSFLWGRFATRALDTGLPGVNALTSLELPQDRVVLATGGPAIGPAVLFWGFIPLLLVAAILLGRSARTPLTPFSWFVVMLGLAQSSLAHAPILVFWVLVLCLRPSIPEMQARGWRNSTIKLVQLGLFGLTALVALTLYRAVHSALLGYPNMLVRGNGSSAHQLFWYQDRFSSLPDPGWVVSISLTTYRVLMLLWALWLALAMIRGLRWLWHRIQDGGLWVSEPAPENPPPPPPGKGPSPDSPAAAAGKLPGSTSAGSAATAVGSEQPADGGTGAAAGHAPAADAADAAGRTDAATATIASARADSAEDRAPAATDSTAAAAADSLAAKQTGDATPAGTAPAGQKPRGQLARFGMLMLQLAGVFFLLILLMVLVAFVTYISR